MIRATEMSASEIIAELSRLGDQWDALRLDEDGHGGSPGEWMIERMGELETEQTRRKKRGQK
jgi:hypothetical protein